MRSQEEKVINGKNIKKKAHAFKQNKKNKGKNILKMKT